MSQKIKHTLAKISIGDYHIEEEQPTVSVPGKIWINEQFGNFHFIPIRMQAQQYQIDKDGFQIPQPRQSGTSQQSYYNYQYQLSISDIKVLEVIGTGQSGCVQKAVYLKTNQLIALKAVKYIHDEKFAQQMNLELQTLVSSNHENIVKCYGAFVQDQLITIILEYMDLGTLADLIRKVGPLPEVMLGFIAYQVLKGLDYLHRVKRIIHRDIKPQNLLVNSEGVVKISDFGVSGQLLDENDQRSTWIGTVMYMAPERFHQGSYSSITDIWSLGMTLLECALGRFPYDLDVSKGGFWKLQEAITQNPIPQPPDSYCSEMKDFFNCCLKKNPADRISADQLLVSVLVTLGTPSHQEIQTHRFIPHFEELVVELSLNYSDLVFFKLMNNQLQELLANGDTEMVKILFPLRLDRLDKNHPYLCMNFVNREWKHPADLMEIIDPLNGEIFLKVPNTLSEQEFEEFRLSALRCPKSGLHNPFKNPQRYVLYGEVCHRAAFLLGLPTVEDYFTKLIQRVTPKHDKQARAEVKVTQKFLMNFSGDQCRFLMRSFQVSGDHYGQRSSGHRFPFGPVAIICPFNFPLEIPALQMLGALIAGNKLLIKGDQRVSVVLEMFLRLLHYCGMPVDDCDLIHCDGPQMEELLKKTPFRMLQFTGSSNIAERLCSVMKGKIKIEDAGFDWKILGPDVQEVDYVVWQCDQDAYAFSGQKCSAQSILFAHSNWVKMGLFDKIKDLAERRKLEDFTICPILTWSNKRIQAHVDSVLQIPGAKLLFGGRPIQSPHHIPEVYGSYLPTAIAVPIHEVQSHFELITTELFGPFQIIVEYVNIDHVLEILERIPHNLTAGVVSNDIQFVNYVLANTINGVTYAGIRGRTTGAPQNHWFGPCGDPRGAGIGTPEAIIQTWTTHREIVMDICPADIPLSQS